MAFPYFPWAGSQQPGSQPWLEVLLCGRVWVFHITLPVPIAAVCYLWLRYLCSLNPVCAPWETGVVCVFVLLALHSQGRGKLVRCHPLCSVAQLGT